MVIAQAIGDAVQSDCAQRGLGNEALGADDLVTAEAAYQQSLATLRAVSTPALIAESLAGLAQGVGRRPAEGFTGATSVASQRIAPALAEASPSLHGVKGLAVQSSQPTPPPR